MDLFKRKSAYFFQNFPKNVIMISMAYLRGGGGGFGGFNPHPTEIFRFFLKSEGKVVEKK